MFSPTFQPDSPGSTSTIRDYYPPIYQASFERYHGPDKHQEVDQELEDEFAEYQALMEFRSNQRSNALKEWKQKRDDCLKELNQLKFNPVEEFFEADMFSENIPNDINPLESQDESVPNLKLNKKVELYEDLNICSLFSATYEDMSNEYNTDQLKFEDQEIKDVKNLLNHEKLDFKIKPDSVDKNLFIERNLFRAIQFHNQIDPKFIKDHFPMKEGFDKIDVNYFQSVDNLKFVNNRIQEIAERDKYLKNLFIKDRDRKFFKKMIERKDNYSKMAIIMYFLFVRSDHMYNNRHKKLVELDSSLFSKCPYRDRSCSEIFSFVNIFFFEDFCNFRIYKRFIANSVLNNLRKIVENRKKEKGKKFRRLEFECDNDSIRDSVLHDVRIHFMDPKLGIDDADDIEFDPKHKSANRIQNNFDYSSLKLNEIRHEIIKF